MFFFFWFGNSFRGPEKQRREKLYMRRRLGHENIFSRLPLNCVCVASEEEEVVLIVSGTCGNYFWMVDFLPVGFRVDEIFSCEAILSHRVKSEILGLGLFANFN